MKTKNMREMEKLWASKAKKAANPNATAANKKGRQNVSSSGAHLSKRPTNG
jgi:hypothetical protein